jgi:F0F1-type ATP synthase assembly protein I
MDDTQSKKPWWRDSVLFFVRVSSWVVIPVIISLFLGKALDKKFGTTPWVFVGLTALSFTISIFGLVKESGAYMKKITEASEKNKKHGDTGNTDTTK